VIEIKTVEQFSNATTAQVVSFLKLSNYKLSLLSIFYVTSLKNGVKKVIKPDNTSKKN